MTAGEKGRQIVWENQERKYKGKVEGGKKVKKKKKTINIKRAQDTPAAVCFARISPDTSSSNRTG